MNRQQRRTHNAQQRTQPDTLTPIPPSEWKSHPKNILNVWRSRQYFVQLYRDDAALRITINRTELKAGTNWKDNIPFEDLMRIKREIGYGDTQAIEIYPPDAEVVNVANMRHLWIPNDRLNIGFIKCHEI